MYRSGMCSKFGSEGTIFGESEWYMVFLSHSTIVTDEISPPRIIHSDNNNTLSRQVPSRMHTVNMVTATTPPTTIWEISDFQRFQQEDDDWSWTEGPPLTFYSVWVRRHLIFGHNQYNKWNAFTYHTSPTHISCEQSATLANTEAYERQTSLIDTLKVTSWPYKKLSIKFDAS